MKQRPDMMSICFNAHDECFQPDPDLSAGGTCTASMTAKSWRNTAATPASMASSPKWRPFTMGRFGTRGASSIWGCWYAGVDHVLSGLAGRLLDSSHGEGDAVHAHHKPEDFHYSVSVMDPATQWQVLTQAILLGGHVRVGWRITHIWI